jgi:peptide/nickel transport system permease protein
VNYWLRRLLLVVVTLFGLITAVFLVTQVIGDPARMMLPLDASEDEVLRLRSSLGLDTPLWLRYLGYLGDVVTLDFGASIWSGRAALDVAIAGLIPTMQLAAVTLVVATIVGVSLGAWMGTKAGKLTDRLGSITNVIAISLPNFWVALLLIVAFSVGLRALPSSGYGSAVQYVLPVAAIAIGVTAKIAEVVRANVVIGLEDTYYNTVRAKGKSHAYAVYRHVLPNALIPVVTLISDVFVALIAGVGTIEVIFGWPGIARLMIDSVGRRDFPVIQTSVLLLGALIILINLLVDVCYRFIDPRVRIEAGGK